MVETEGMKMSTYDESIISDLHKDVYGFRPRQDWWANWKAISEDAKQAIWDYLCDECDAQIVALCDECDAQIVALCDECDAQIVALCDECDAQIVAQKVRDDEALKDFEARVAQTIQLGAPDRDTAILWIVDSLDLSENDLWYGAEYVCHRLHLSYDNYGVFKDAVDELIARRNLKFSMEG
jgi:hypothetical protein